jgi:hypothetical protein
MVYMIGGLLEGYIHRYNILWQSLAFASSDVRDKQLSALETVHMDVQLTVYTCF